MYTVKEFCNNVSRDINGFIDSIAEEKSRVMGQNEKAQLADSYGQVSKMLAMAVSYNPKVSDVHICSMANMLVEYKLPAASAWCDLVMIGKGKDEKPEVMIIELKNFEKSSVDMPGTCEGLIEHNGVIRQHPSDQVKGYTEYCRYFHSAVQEHGAHVNGLVYFTQNLNVEPYTQYPNEELTQEYPCYNASNSQALANYIAETITDENKDFAVQFVNGFYKQNRNVLLQVGQSLKGNRKAKPFVLLDEQRTGFHKVMDLLSKREKDGKKEVIIVQGPPGCGKSAVAINIWIEAVTKYAERETCGNIVYVTTSSSQKDNWNKIFTDYGTNYSAKRLVLRSTDYNPGLNGSNLKHLVDEMLSADSGLLLPATNTCGYKANPKEFRKITDWLIKSNHSNGYKDNLHFISVVDEAHALINPVAEGFNSNKPSGWYFGVGPQAYHIIRESQISIFFTDDKQSFRDNETTSVADIEKYAKELQANVTRVDLSDLQFRCAGSKDYVQWIEDLFTDKPSLNREKWKDVFTFEVYDSATKMEEQLKERLACGDRHVRLASTYSRPWVSHELNENHSNGIDQQGDVPYDFVLGNPDGNYFKKYWNNPQGYEIFVQAAKGRMKEDPLCEVGCPYVIRGFDYTYIGQLWLEDLVYRERLGGWVVQAKYACETATNCSKSAAIKELIRAFRPTPSQKHFDKKNCYIPVNEPRLPECHKFAKSVVQAYRILMTRALKGMYVYIKDDETRAYINHILEEPK